MNLNDFQRAAGITQQRAQQWLDPLNAAMAEFFINTPLRQAGFIAQIGHESLRFTRVVESLYYRDAERLAPIFRSDFDRNKNRKIDPAELEFARGFVGKPQATANFVYADQGGNGPESSGDGWRYRGRGLIQITLKNNYRACGQALGLDLLNNPDLLLEPVNAARSAAWYWYQHGCNAPADAANVVEVTRKINPELVGLNDRAMLFEKARRALCPSKN
ncbi:TPA: glycoside hydrolase family 19 protein [Klebsiella variicola subsp. variicola]